MTPFIPRASSSRVCDDVIVIGAGHAGLATSYLLTEAGLSHVVLERGETANAWKTERWDSLRLLTPSWLTRLPGARYLDEADDGFMHVSELADFLDDYAKAFRLPVVSGANVTSLRRRRGIFEAHTESAVWQARTVVLASGAFNNPAVPKIAEQMPDNLMQMTPFDYRSPDSVATDGVLIVGASATGLQLADELVNAGRKVTLAVGEHVRMPRRYRGEDIFYWLHRSGIHDQRYDELDDIERGRNLPSPQLMGRRSPDLDLNDLQNRGVQLTGKLLGCREGRLLFSGGLRNVCALADLKMARLLKQIDPIADAEGAVQSAAPVATRLENTPPVSLDINDSSIDTVIWATGFKPDYSWLHIPVLNHKGQLRHDGGIVVCPGLYALGLPLLRRRKSSFIFGIEDDARDIVSHLTSFLKTDSRRFADDLYSDAHTRASARRRA